LDASADRLSPTHAWFAGWPALAMPVFNPRAAKTDIERTIKKRFKGRLLTVFGREPPIRLIRRPAEDDVRLQRQAALPMLACQWLSTGVSDLL
jgi:hypothetical protein